MGYSEIPTARPSNDWLRLKYIDEGVDANAIGRIVGRAGKTIWEWIRAAGIPTRSRGRGNPSLHFKKGNHSPTTGKRRPDTVRAKVGAASRQRGAVPYMKNGVHWMKATGRKPANYKGGITPERQAFYRSEEWKSAVKQVWHRDNATCCRCGDHHNHKDLRGTFAIHHVDGFQITERRADPTNLILVCAPCHRWIHGKNNTEKLFLGRGH